MKTIYKYPLEIASFQWIEMPEEAEILCIQMQYGRLQMWAIVDPDKPKQRRGFHTYTTGHALGYHEKYLGTYQTKEGLVFHVFE